MPKRTITFAELNSLTNKIMERIISELEFKLTDDEFEALDEDIYAALFSIFSIKGKADGPA